MDLLLPIAAIAVAVLGFGTLAVFVYLLVNGQGEHAQRLQDLEAVQPDWDRIDAVIKAAAAVNASAALVADDLEALNAIHRRNGPVHQRAEDTQEIPRQRPRLEVVQGGGVPGE